MARQTEAMEMMIALINQNYCEEQLHGRVRRWSDGTMTITAITEIMIYSKHCLITK